MELIPILATIILVATISTFFLSIGAYVLFKVRESKGYAAKMEAPAQTIQAELVTPEPVSQNTEFRESREQVRKATAAGFSTTQAQAPRSAPAQTQATQPAMQRVRGGGAPEPAAAPTPQRRFAQQTSESAQPGFSSTGEQQRKRSTPKWK